MAVNSSGGPPVNALADDDRFDLGELGRIRDVYHTEPAAIRAARERGQKAQERLTSIEEQAVLDPSILASQAIRKSYAVNSNIVESVNTRMRVYQEAKLDRLNERAVNAVNRDFAPSAVNSFVASNMNSIEMQAAGASLTGRGYVALDQERAAIMGRMQSLRKDSVNAASTYIDPTGVNSGSESVLKGNAAEMKELAKQLIPITVAMQQLKQQGLDPKSRQEELARIGNRASGLLNSNQLQEEVLSGKGLGGFSAAELKKKEAEAAEKLIKALSALNNAAGKSADELTELNKQAEEAAKDFERFGDAAKIKKGDDGGNKWENAKIIAGTVMEALEIGTNMYHNVTIAQPMQMVANTAAAANLENQKYSSWHAALAGNMQERMNLDWTGAQAFGNKLADSQNTIHNLRQGNALIGGVLGGAQVGVAIAGGMQGTAFGTNNVVEQGALGAKSFISSAAIGVSELAAQQRQTEMAALRIQGQQAWMAAQKSLTHITGQQLQGYRDYAMGINETAGAMGGVVGNDFLNETGGADFLQRMSAAGIGTKEFSALSLRSAQMAGSRFNKDQIFTAVDLERQGFGNAEENMRRISMLGAAGQGDSSTQLGKIIEDAMQRGLNSSKAIDMIVENTAKMSEDALMAGAASDPTTGIASQILKAVDQDNPNKEQALRLAQRGFERGEAARTNISASFPGILNVDRNMKEFGVDRLSATLLTKLSSAQVAGLKGLDENATKEYLERMGISTANMSPSMLKGDNLYAALNKNAAVSVLAQQSGVGYAIGNPGAFANELAKNKGNDKVLQALVYGKNLSVLTPEQRALRERQAATSWLNGANPIEDMARAGVLMGVLDKTQTEKDLKSLGLDSRMNLTDEKRLGNRAQAAQAAQGAGALGASAQQAMSALAESGRQAFEKMGANAEKIWSTAAEKTAANFGNSATLMNGASSNLEQASKTMVTNTQMMAAAGADFAASLSAAWAKISDKMKWLESKLPKDKIEKRPDGEETIRFH